MMPCTQTFPIDSSRNTRFRCTDASASVQGEVYRAKDTKLGRDVAIKVLPEELAQDKERLARFRREAKVLASLNHPGIASIYGFEESEGRHYLILELVPGETLAARLARGPIPVEEARRIAVRVAEALEEAHERGIVHRDLKPANIMLTPDGKVKVLDFGLAKAFAEETPDADSSMSPTLTRDATRAGVILGTAAYMSPEQAKGKQVDKRTDIWAFGAVLYEMLTGTKAFPGDDVSEILASVIKSEPDWSRVRKTTPETLVKLLRRSLVKDSRQRLRDIGEARLTIEARTTEPEISSSRTTTDWRVVLPWGLVAVLLLVLAIGWRGEEPATDKDVAHVSIDLPDDGRLSTSSDSLIAISPDGNLLAFSAGFLDAPQLYLRDLNQEEASPIPGALGASHPFFSPDGKWLGFFQNNKLMKVAVEGGPTIELAANGGAGGTWMPDDAIIYNPGFSNGGVVANLLRWWNPGATYESGRVRGGTGPRSSAPPSRRKACARDRLSLPRSIGHISTFCLWKQANCAFSSRAVCTDAMPRAVTSCTSVGTL